jgi:hypothetical protein
MTYDLAKDMLDYPDTNGKKIIKFFETNGIRDRVGRLADDLCKYL